MDHAVYPIEKVLEAFARALALDTNREAAAHAAAQSLGINVESVRAAVGQQEARAS
jgi:hypothetical protein